jgi:hypothetical protein
MAALSQSFLDGYKGKSMAQICPFAYNTGNQCAHFVSHVLEIGHGATCKNITWANKNNKAITKGACLRANEVYNNCASRGPWADRDAALTSCLIFVTDAAHVKNNLMTDHPQKHVGVYFNGTIWHYSNTRKQVETDTPETWLAKFQKVYAGPNISLFYGKHSV